MSDVKIKDLSPVPFFAHFLEGQFSQNLTEEEMKAIRGGSAVTLAYPSDQEGTPSGELPDLQEPLHRVGKRRGQLPGDFSERLVTQVYPSDGENVPDVLFF